MNIFPAIGTNSELAFPGQPTRAFVQRPSESAQATAMSVVPRAISAQCRDVATSAVGIRIVDSVGVDSLWSTPGMPLLATNRRHGIDQRFQLLEVVLVGCGESGCQRYALAIDDHVLLAASFPPVDGAGPGLLPSAEGAVRATLNRDTRPVDLIRSIQFGQQLFVELLPNSGLGPVPKATPTRHPGTATQLLGQILPGDAGLEDKEYADQRLAILHGLAAGVAKPPVLGRAAGARYASRDPRARAAWPWLKLLYLVQPGQGEPRAYRIILLRLLERFAHARRTER